MKTARALLLPIVQSGQAPGFSNPSSGKAREEGRGANFSSAEKFRFFFVPSEFPAGCIHGAAKSVSTDTFRASSASLKIQF